MKIYPKFEDGTLSEKFLAETEFCKIDPWTAAKSWNAANANNRVFIFMVAAAIFRYLWLALFCGRSDAGSELKPIP
jgi:hypothetical protein